MIDMGVEEFLAAFGKSCGKGGGCWCLDGVRKVG